MDFLCEGSPSMYHHQLPNHVGNPFYHQHPHHQSQAAQLASFYLNSTGHHQYPHHHAYQQVTDHMLSSPAAVAAQQSYHANDLAYSSSGSSSSSSSSSIGSAHDVYSASPINSKPHIITHVRILRFIFNFSALDWTFFGTAASNTNIEF